MMLLLNEYIEDLQLETSDITGIHIFIFVHCAFLGWH